MNAVYQPILSELERRGAVLCGSSPSLKAFQQQLARKQHVRL